MTRVGTPVYCAVLSKNYHLDQRWMGRTSASRIVLGDYDTLFNTPGAWGAHSTDFSLLRCYVAGGSFLSKFSGTILIHEPFVFFDVVWLARGLKPILCHKVRRNEFGQHVFGDRVLAGGALVDMHHLVNHAVLRERVSRDLWGLEMIPDDLQATLQDLLVILGVAVPFPREGDNPGGQRGSSEVCCRRGLLIVMRLQDKPTEDMQVHLEERRESWQGLRLSWEFHRDGAPHGLPERVLALRTRSA